MPAGRRYHGRCWLAEASDDSVRSCGQITTLATALSRSGSFRRVDPWLKLLPAAANVLLSLSDCGEGVVGKRGWKRSGPAAGTTTGWQRLGPRHLRRSRSRRRSRLRRHHRHTPHHHLRRIRRELAHHQPRPPPHMDGHRNSGTQAHQADNRLSTSSRQLPGSVPRAAGPVRARADSLLQEAAPGDDPQSGGLADPPAMCARRSAPSPD